MDTSKLKKLMIMRVFIAWILCICVLIMQVDNFWLCWWKQRSIKKYSDVWDGIKNKIKAIYNGKENHYGKDCVKIKFNSDDDLPLNKH